MTNLQKPCLQCGKTIIKPYTESLKNWVNRHKYCSRSCLAKYTYSQKVEKHQFTKERHYIPPTAIKKGQRLSPKTEFGKGLTPWNKNKPMGKELYKKLKDTGFFNPKYGERSANWRGGTTELKSLIRGNAKYKEWKSDCLKRDNYTCQECKIHFIKGITGRVYLEVDHIKPFALIIRENSIKSLFEAFECKELWRMENARTLCKDCHKKTDTYGYNFFKSLKQNYYAKNKESN